MKWFKEFCRNECSGWRAWEVIWLAAANAVILGVSIWLGDSVTGILASLTGVTCVILCGKGKLSNYIFGTVNTLLYAYMAFQAKYYGDVMLNMLYYFPTNFIGWYAWSKNVNEERAEVYKRRLTLRQDVLLAAACGAGIYGYGLVLRMLGGNLPLVDSMSTVLSVVAQILLILRFMEQWIIWIVVDVVTVIMWAAAYFNEGGSIAVLMMWLVFLTNAVIMFVKWLRESKGQEAGGKGTGVKGARRQGGESGSAI